ncbi:MAG: response regulator [Candidatus Sericytochromatia bacterium]
MKKKNINILIADDEPLIRMDLKEILEEKGYNVVDEARNGLEVLDFCQSNKPDLIILDIKMPEMDGLETLKKLNSSLDYPKVPVIMLTAYSQPELIEQAVGLGVFAYIVKPVKEYDLLPAIEITLARANEMSFIQKEVGKLKETLEVRKLVEKAKGLLMARENIDEPEAFRRIQKLSMDTRKPMKEIAEEVIKNNLN